MSTLVDEPFAPPTGVEMSAFAQALYDELEPLQYGEADSNYSLAKLCSAIAEPFNEVWDLVIVPSQAWQDLMNLGTTPTDFLDWLGRFKGVAPVGGEDDAQKRARIDDAAALDRGTPASVVAWAQQALTGSQHVFMEERYGGSAWRLRLTVYDSELLTDVAAVKAAVMNTKPAGIVLDATTGPGNINVVPGETWDEVNAATTWDAVGAGVTWDTAEGL